MSFFILAAAVSFGVGILAAEVRLRGISSAEGVVIYDIKDEPVKMLEGPVPETNLEKAEEKQIPPEPSQVGSETEIKPEINGESFTFAVLGDTQGFAEGSSNGAFQQAAKNITKNNPDLVLSTGDLISGCDKKDLCEAKYNAWKAVMGPLMNKTYMVQGNHDRTGGEDSELVWQKVFTLPANGPEKYIELVYSIDFKNSHFVFLDSAKPKEHVINQVQRDWLEKDLSANKKENTFVVFHEIAYPVSSKIGEGLDAKPDERNALWDMLARHKVTAVFSGHEHIASRKNIAGVYQFGIGNTDAFNHEAPKSGMAEYSYVGKHFAMVEVDGKKITVKTHSVSGNLLDSFSFSK